MYRPCGSEQRTKWEGLSSDRYQVRSESGVPGGPGTAMRFVFEGAHTRSLSVERESPLAGSNAIFWEQGALWAPGGSCDACFLGWICTTVQISHNHSQRQVG